VHFNRLSYYVLPPLPVGYTAPNWFFIKLRVLAGRLYINFAKCAPLTKYLQLTNKTNIKALQRGGEHVSTFTKNPIDFLLEWLTLCHKRQDIIRTPMGYVCQGRPLHKSHPFFVTQSTDTKEVITPLVGDKTGGNVDKTQDRSMDLEDETDPQTFLCPKLMVLQ
jgi:hypothetical protein